MLSLDYQHHCKEHPVQSRSWKRFGLPVLLIIVVAFFHSVASFFLIWSGWSTNPIGPRLEAIFHFPLLDTFGYTYSLTDPSFFALLLLNSFLNSTVVVGAVYGAIWLFRSRRSMKASRR